MHLIGQKVKERLMDIKIDRISGSVILIFAVCLIVHIFATLRLGNPAHPGSGYVPFLLALTLSILGAVILLRGELDQRLKSVQWVGYWHVLYIMVSCIFAIFALEKLGYRITTSIVLILLFGFLERMKPWLVIILTLALSFGSFWVFRSILKVPLPQGVF